jgi:colanic acid/amylovoran biosynthesis protein
MDHVKIAPDFTNLVQGIKPSYLDDIAGKCCIVPNQRMLDKTSQEVSKAYISLLVSGIKYLQLKGLEAFLLIHEENDIAIANILQSKLDQPILMIKETNPLILKGILGNCYLVIGSRFHSLISAFSQGVPCVGAGWSHKYKILFKDYGCSNLLVNLNNNSQNILDLLDLLINETKRTEIIQNINYNADIQKTLARQMWDEVRAELS